jgi:cysteine desulfurase
VRAEAAEEISRVLRSGYGNPSSIHRRGHRSKILLESSRESVACLIGARPEEIVFTSGGTESNNLAVLGAALRAGSGHLVVSAIEHSSVLEASRHLETIGFRVSRVPPGSGGVVDPGALLDAVRPETVLISLIHSSNEIGTLQPVTEVCRRLGRPEVLVHSDAVQSAGKTPLDVATLGADLVSFSAHKLGGPPGVGALWIRGGIRLAPLFHGGGQESHRRAGTETLPLIAGFAVAARLAAQEISGESLRLGALRDALEAALARRIPGVRFHGRGAPRLPNTLSVAVEGCSGEALAIALDLEGIAVSTGSACAVGTVRPSHVLLALGCSEQVARSTLRISLGRATSPAEVERFAEVLEAVVGRMRAPAECLSAAADLRRRA